MHMFMNQRDTREFVDWLISSFGVTFVEDRSRDLPLPMHCDLESICSRIFGPSEHRRFALIHPEWSPHPLIASHIVPTNGSAPFHSLCLRYGGPSFDFIAARVAQTDCGERFIVPGTFSDYPTYYIEKGLQGMIRRPTEMMAIWRQVQAYFRRNGQRTICRELQSVGPFVMRHALADYSDGTWLRIGSHRYTPRTELKTEQDAGSRRNPVVSETESTTAGG